QARRRLRGDEARLRRVASGPVGCAAAARPPDRGDLRVPRAAAAAQPVGRDDASPSMNILLVAPMPPSPTAALAVPRVLHAQLVGLSERHRVTLAVVAGPEAPELEAVERLRADGVDLHAVCRHEPGTFAERWARRRRLAGGWLRGGKPWRTVWYFDPGLQPLLDRLLSERRFDIVAVEDNAAAVYDFGSSAPVVFTEHDVRRPRPFRIAGNPSTLLAEVDWRRWPGYHRRTWRRFDLIQVFTERDAAGVGE